MTTGSKSTLYTRLRCMWLLVLSFRLHVVFLLENVNYTSRDYLSGVFDFHEYKCYHVLAPIALFLFQ